MLQHFKIFLLLSLFFTTLQAQAIYYHEDIPDLLDCIAEEADTKEKVDCYIQLARYYRQIDKDSSLLFSERAFDISDRIGYTEGCCDALYRRSQTLDYMGNLKDALYYCEACLEIAESINDSVRMAKAYFKMASLFNETSNKQPVRAYYNKALQIFMHRRDTSALIAVYNGLGNFYQDISIYDSSAYYFHRSISLCERSGHTQALGRIFGNLGIVYRKLWDYENAEKYSLLSLDYCIKNKDENELPLIYSRLGVLASDQDDYSTAIRYYDLAESASRVTGDSISLYEVYVNRARVYRYQGKYNEALALLKEALSYYRQQDFAEGIIASWQNMAWIYSKINIEKQAFLYFDSCISLAQAMHDLSRQKQVYGDMYDFYSDQGKHKQALDAYVQYQQLTDSIFSLEKTEIINDLLLKYEKEKDQLLILSLENENLEKVKQRNLLLFIVFGIVAIGLFLVFFLIYKSRKNRIIAEQKIMQLEEEKKHLAARFLVEGEEKERKRIALELHDNLGVLLSATKMQFTEIRDKSPENAALVTKATQFLEQASKDVRKISHNLMPGLLTKLGLYEALEDLFETLDESEGLDAVIDVVGPQDRLDENKEIMIYRMMQEIVNNTLKHASASKIDLTLIVDAEELNISYADNGKGFEVEEIIDKKSIGLQSILSRVKFLDGRIKIDSAKGTGSVFRICIPLGPGHCQ